MRHLHRRVRLPRTPDHVCCSQRARTAHLTRRWPLCSRGYATTDRSPNADAVDPYDIKLLREPPRNVAVLGGGITGLTAAYTLRRELPEASKITLYEASHRFGGWLETTEAPVAGQPGQKIRFERGPRMIKALNESRTRFDDLVLWSIVKDAGLPIMGFKGLDSMILNRHGSLISARKFGDILRSVTDYPVSLFLRLAFQYLRYKLPAFAGGYRPPPGDDITLSDFMRQMTGSDNFMDRLASAMVHGISGGNPDTTSLREFHFGLYRNIYHRAKAQLSNRRPDSTKVPIFPADKELLERMSLMLGDITEMVESGAGQTQHYCFVDGMQSLPDWMSNVLATQSNIDLKTNTPVTKVRYDTDARQVLVTSRNNKGEEETQSFDAVVSTIPAQQLVDIAPPSSLPSLESCRSVTIQTVNLWYPRKDLVPKKTLGYLIPRGVSRENNPHRALGVLFDSEAIVPVGSEPSGTKLFVLMGGHFYDSELSPPPDDATAIQQARETVHKQLGIPLDLEPGAAVAKLAKECLPQFEIGHASRMVKAHHELLDAFAGKLSVAGPSYKGMGILGGMRAGWDIAMRLAGRVESAHMGYTGLAGFETMQRDGPISDVFVPHSLVGRFRSDPLKQIYGQQRHQDAQKSARRR